jgi:osmotically inducible lipoprotein OsmB
VARTPFGVFHQRNRCLKGPAMKKALAISFACLALTACGTYRSDRAISGGLMGAGAGAIGGPVGILAGGAIGAGAGAFTSPGFINLGAPVWRRSAPRQVTVDPDGRYNPSRANVTLDAYGYGRVTFENNCSVYYDGAGLRQSTTGPCANDQIVQAEREMADYRRRAAPATTPATTAPVQGLDFNRMRTDCEAAAERTWGLRQGEARATSVRGEDRTGYEIGFTAGTRTGSCQASSTGQVTGIRQN